MSVKGTELHEPDLTNPERADSAIEDAAQGASAQPEADEAKEAAETDHAEPDDDDTSRNKKPARRLRLSISFRTLGIAVMITALVAATAVFGCLYFGAKHKLDAQARQADNNAHAEKMAMDYAVHAAEINFGDLNAWKAKLVEGTSPALKDKLTKAGDEMEQIFVPLQWTSTASPLVAKVRSDNGGAYVVDCFVSVLTKTVQSPSPLQSTATYSITLDSNKNWEISDVGGIGAMVEPN